MNILNMLNTIALVVCVSGCGQAGSSEPVDLAQSIAPALPTSEPTSQPIPLPSVDPTSPNNIALTYYTRSTTIAPVAGHSLDTITLTASCVVYTGNTYCWDNGEQEIIETVSHLTTDYYYSYFSLGRQTTNGLLGVCYGGCPMDAMSVPTIIDSNLNTNITTSYTTDHYAQSTVATVLTGTPTAVNCAEADGLLNCVDFVIDLNQVAL